MSKVEKEGWVGDVFSWFGNTLSSMWAKAEPTVVSHLRAFFAEFEGIAITAIQAEAPKLLTGKEKFSSAVSSVANTVAAQGWTVAISVIETLVQDAYMTWSANQPQSTSLITPPAK